LGEYYSLLEKLCVFEMIRENLLEKLWIMI